MRFVDTDVLLYAVSTTEAGSRKARVARDVLSRRDLALSAQVLGEFYVQATRVTRADRLSHDQAGRLVESFTRWPVQPVTTSVVRGALATSSRLGLSYWDAAVVEAARTLGCDELLTEDLQHGQDLEGVKVTNPFL